MMPLKLMWWLQRLQLYMVISLIGCGKIYDPYVSVESVMLPIKDGNVATTCDLPSVVQLNNQCSGVLIAPRLVAFAGHCGLNIHTVTLKGRSGVDITHSVLNCVSPYNSSPNPDIGFCVLATSVEDGTITPIVPTCLEPIDWSGLPVLVAGYGVDGPSGAAGTKKFFYGKISKYSGSEITIQIGDGGTCSGDSGGPVYARLGKFWFLIGIIRSGDSTGCDRDMAFATPLLPWIEWIEKEVHVRGSPCYLHGIWAPNSRCGLLVEDGSSSDASCLTGQSTYSDSGPCANLPIPTLESFFVSAPKLISFFPASRAVINPDLNLKVGVKIIPANAEAQVDLVVVSPKHLTWSQYFEFPPFELPIPNPEAGEWEIHTMVKDVNGNIIVQSSSFILEERTFGPGCSIENTRSGTFEMSILIITCLLSSTRRRGKKTQKCNFRKGES